uniref:Poly A polymerase head domain-containing protein n=1 Tax=Compsopogon caeruleus TaxID=31354 RepID=A0A7S1TBR5_9RHOD|mmetsp:Transcript_16423/g.33485  ORF Transcript_16423/g.33485 Transcript_16423/m.33485 type:complete len:545 (+) Transcript_16423:428-2062(+)
MFVLSYLRVGLGTQRRGPGSWLCRRQCASVVRMMSAAATRSPVPTSIRLTELEERLFDTLMTVVDERGLRTTLRVGGGWVRDKLLGLDVDEVDIDIALDDMLGREFAEMVNQWLCDNKLESHHVGVIKCNPEQSKHLETARIKIFGLWIDLVNLRTETYTHNSRIPDVSIGTPEEDARRRDLTINSCFFNVNERIVEDFTGHGISDLRAKVIRTPLPPLTTLLDDPLRALRSIRFASRLNFHVDPELYESYKSCLVHDALVSKISRERIATELQKMITGPSPDRAMGLIREVGLMDAVFVLPSDTEPPKPRSTNLWVSCLGCLVNHCALRRRRLRFADHVNEFSVLVARLSAFLAPLAACHYQFKGKSIHVSQFTLRELRLPSKEIELVSLVLSSSVKFKKMVEKNADALDRLEIGQLIRKTGRYWKVAVETALVSEIGPIDSEQSYAQAGPPLLESFSEQDGIKIDVYERFMGLVDSLEMEGIWDLKPLLDGRRVLDLLPGLPKGPAIGYVMDRQIEWQIVNPSGGEDDCKRWLTHEFRSYVK